MLANLGYDFFANVEESQCIYLRRHVRLRQKCADLLQKNM